MARHHFKRITVESQRNGTGRVFNHAAHCNSVQLPPIMDLRPFCPPATDQGETGSSTAHALAAARTMLARSVSLLFSVSMRGYGVRTAKDRDQAETSVKEMVGALKKRGICLASELPAVSDAADTPLPASVLAHARQYRIRWGAVVHGLLGVKIALLIREQPVLLGVTVFESFEGSELAQTGIVQMPAPEEAALGVHDMLIVGWTDIVQGKIMPIDGWSTTKEDCDHLDRLFRRCGYMGYFIVRNSWGENWGKNGYCLLPYEYAIKYGREQWAIG